MIGTKRVILSREERKAADYERRERLLTTRGEKGCEYERSSTLSFIICTILCTTLQHTSSQLPFFKAHEARRGASPTSYLATWLAA
jgi:hypothetical protein